MPITLQEQLSSSGVEKPWNTSDVMSAMEAGKNGQHDPTNAEDSPDDDEEKFDRKIVCNNSKSQAQVKLKVPSLSRKNYLRVRI